VVPAPQLLSVARQGPCTYLQTTNLTEFACSRELAPPRLCRNFEQVVLEDWANSRVGGWVVQRYVKGPLLLLLLLLLLN
jgi:hypothetical protein